jgi:hypothetical protein
MRRLRLKRGSRILEYMKSSIRFFSTAAILLGLAASFHAQNSVSSTSGTASDDSALVSTDASAVSDPALLAALRSGDAATVARIMAKGSDAERLLRLDSVIVIVNPFFARLSPEDKLDSSAEYDFQVLTPIQVAFFRDDTAMMALLLSKGADLGKPFVGTDGSLAPVSANALELAAMRMGSFTPAEARLFRFILSYNGSLPAERRMKLPDAYRNAGYFAVADDPAGFENALGGEAAAGLALLPVCLSAGSASCTDLVLSRNHLSYIDSFAYTSFVLRYGKLAGSGGPWTVSAFSYAMLEGSANIVRQAIEKGVDPDLAVSYEPRLRTMAGSGPAAAFSPEETRTPMQFYAERDEVAMMEWLIAHHADFRALDSAGYAPIHYAALNGDAKAIGLLVGKGAEVDSRTDDGMTPLMLAARQGDLNAATYLVEKKADVGATEDGNWSVLHCAALSGNLELVKYLVAAGASPRLRSYTSIFYVLPGIAGARPTLPLNAGSYPADSARAMARFLRGSGLAAEAEKRESVAAYLDAIR